MKSPVRNVILCVAFMFVGLVVWESIAPKYPRSQLPPTASEIHDYDTSGVIGFQADYFYLLTAKIDENEFQAFVDELGFAESKLSVDWWPRMNGFDWWTPEQRSDRLYASTNKWTPNAVAKHENGKLYYKEWSGY